MKVLITGTSGGIGKAAAELFLARGHEVSGMDVLPAALAHPRYTHYLKNILDKDLPPIDGVEILINCAGVQTGTLEDIDVNLKGTIAVTEKYGLQKDIKSILLIASASGRNGAEFPAYAASKGGVIAYAKNVALRVAEWGAVCNSLSPGGVNTDSNARVLNDPVKREAVMREALLGKWAASEEIAEWIYFLTVVNKSMTGEDLLIDNGEMLKSNFIW